MLSIRRINPMARAIGTMGVVMALVGAVTFAALTTNTVALTGNQMEVTNDVLRISNGGAFVTSASGFDFSNLVINNESAKQAFYFQNTANAALSLSVTAVGSPETVVDINTSLVHVKFYDKDTTTLLASTTLAALNTGPVALADQLNANAQGNSGVPGTEGNYFVTMEVDSAGVTGPSPSVTGINLSFTGTSL